MMAEHERRCRIEERAAELIAEGMTLHELRKVRQLTQASVARELGISQDAITRLEQRSDLLLSTLRRTVQAMGGVAGADCQISHRPPVGSKCRYNPAGRAWILRLHVGPASM